MSVLGGGYFDMLGRSIIIQGQNSQFGSDTIDFTQTVELNTGAITESVVYRWDHPLGGGGMDELTLVGGDSGEGSFIEYGGEYVLTGTNMGIATDPDTSEKFSFNNFVSPPKSLRMVFRSQSLLFPNHRRRWQSLQPWALVGRDDVPSDPDCMNE